MFIDEFRGRDSPANGQSDTHRSMTRRAFDGVTPPDQSTPRGPVPHHTTSDRRPSLTDAAAALQSVCLAAYGIAQMFELAQDHLLAGRNPMNPFPDWSAERFPLYGSPCASPYATLCATLYATLYTNYPSRHHVAAKTRAFLDSTASLVR
jgi:hypothetical protein